MRSPKETIDCCTHGEAYETFVCEHLVGADGIDWYSAEPIEEDPWPGAWCKECHKAFEAEGEWNESSEKAANLKLSILCHFCYINTRKRCITHEI